MKQLRFTTTKPHSLFELMKEHTPLVNPSDKGLLIMDKPLKGQSVYIHGDAEELAGFDNCDF